MRVCTIYMYSLSLPVVLSCLLLRNLLFCSVLGSSDKNGENGADSLIPMTKRHVGEKAVTDEKCPQPISRTHPDRKPHDDNHEKLYAFIFVISTVLQNKMREKENIVANSYSHR